MVIRTSHALSGSGLVPIAEEIDFARESALFWKNDDKVSRVAFLRPSLQTDQINTHSSEAIPRSIASNPQLRSAAIRDGLLVSLT